MAPVAFITGISCQTGSYLAEILIDKGYQVYGLIHNNHLGNVDHLINKINIVHGSSLDYSLINNILLTLKPQEFYNLAAQGSTYVSMIKPLETMELTGRVVYQYLESIRLNSPTTKFFQASSSSIYGSIEGVTSLDTAFNPRTPYALAKLIAHMSVIQYRQHYNLFACNGILFNHDSPRRQQNTLIQKIVTGAIQIKSDINQKIKLGNLQTIRTWGHAKDFAHGMWLTLQQNQSNDYIFASNEVHTIWDICKEAFEYLGIYDWEQYIERDIECDSSIEIKSAIGDSSKTRTILGWHPSYTFSDMIKEMVDFKLKELK
jgi:GDPmannose 4,6-dehydratase